MASSALKPRLRAEIVSYPNILGGVAVVRGTRVPAEAVLAELDSGTPRTQIFLHYPTLPPDGIVACGRWRQAGRRRAK